MYIYILYTYNTYRLCYINIYVCIMYVHICKYVHIYVCIYMYYIYIIYIGSAISVFLTAGKVEERSTEDLKTGNLQSGHVCLPQE